MSHHCGRYETFTNRRDFLKKAGAGFGLLALADLLQGDGLLAADIEPARALDPMTPRAPHYPAKAKSIVWLFMEGAPSSVDLFDPKPELTKRDGQRIDINVFNGNPGPLMKSPFSFKQHGQSGAWVCEKYPNVAKHVDDFAFIKSLYSESNDHVPALYQINTGIARPGFPSAGAWVTYGLGSESRNLPGYVVLGNSQGSRAARSIGARVFCRRAIRARCSDLRARRFSILLAPNTSRATTSARNSIFSKRSIPSISRSTRANRTCWRAFKVL